MAGAGVILNRTQTARTFGWHLATVDANLRNGMPGLKVGKDWKINSKDVLDWILDREKREAGRNTKDTSDTDIRRRREVAEMERAERQNALESGEVARIDEMSSIWRDQVAVICARLDAVPVRFGMPLAHACASIIGDASAQQIEELRKAVEQQLTIAVSEVRTELASGPTVPDIPGSDEETTLDAE